MTKTAVTLALFLGICLFAAGAKENSGSSSPPPPEAASAAKPASARLEKFWARAKEETYKSPEELAAQHLRERRKGLHYPKLIRGNSSIRAVALTFDDGPHPKFTPQLLALLQHYDVKATFFVVGEMVDKYPDLLRSEQFAGHVIGNHTYHHVNLTRIPQDEIASEWEGCQTAVKQTTGLTMTYCRPPGGDYDREVITTAAALGLTTVLWTNDPGDYADPGRKVIRARVLRGIEDGAVILLHDGVQQTADVLPQIIETLRRRGYQFVTIAELENELKPGGKQR